ncbi:hypothetical protein HCN44_006298 [Aphidius gifuensis]|uniref:BAR domain-containing protein n=2 Tax=Aphidius gifuensis TaxID=684658 RepID=A0A834XTM2_APHGI|nr:hypothetical protein HCN44_006298 [Aphidius gifuensis]
MTWNPRKKCFLTQRPTSAHPLLTPAEDRDLDVAVQQLIHVESSTLKLMKQTKLYLEAICNLDKADQKLTTNLSTSGLVYLSDNFRQIVEDYHSVTNQVGKAVQEMVNLTQKTFLEPLKKLRDKFSLVAEALVKREELLTVWKTSYNRLKKLQEKKDKTANHVAKLEREKRAEDIAAKELKAVHLKLLSDFPWFLEKRLEYVKPSVHALIMIQLDYYGNTTKLFTQLMPAFDNSSSPASFAISDEDYNAKIQKQYYNIINKQ